MATFQLVDQNMMARSVQLVSEIQNSDCAPAEGDPLENNADVEVTNEIISRVGNRKLLFDPVHPHHKNKNLMIKAWAEVSAGLSLRGKPLTWQACRDKWRNLKIYYGRVKREGKGKSGDGRSSGKTWSYYAKMDSVLKSSATENESTTSNLDDEIGAVLGSPGSSVENGSVNDDTDTNEASTPTVIATSSRKRKFVERDDTKEIIELLKSSGKDEDEFYHFGMNLAEKLRKLEPQKAALATMKITNLMFELQYPE